MRSGIDIARASRTVPFIATLALAAAVSGARGAPYADSTLLDVPWGHYSFVRQGWRGYVETLPATRYREGLGIVWGQSPPGKSPDEVAAALSWAGFHRVRIEIPWGSVRWDESGLDEASTARTQEILRALRAHRLRPLILLNANHLKPCPVQWRELRVARRARAGDRVLVTAGRLQGPRGAQATVMSLATATEPGPLITGYAPRGGRESPGAGMTVELSKPLTREVSRGETLRVAMLRYPPLEAVGTAPFELTASGWLRYVALVMDLTERVYGSDDFDVEIWNELTFGSGFLDVAHYYEPRRQSTTPDLLLPGGVAWELARRTVDLIKRTHPDVEVIWGFSNTTFFHVPVDRLPPRLDGQSYHPYGTGRRCYADLIRGRPEALLDSFVPSGCAVQPEGYAQAWQQTESLLRLLAPSARSTHPPGTEGFRHFITEHGFSPAEIGVASPEEAERAKSGFLLRAPLFWLNKGIAALYVYDLYETDATGWGVLASDGNPSAGMRALHRMTEAFAGAEGLSKPRQLSLDVDREGPRAGVLPGDPDGARLPQEQAAALLPFQVNATRFLVGAYLMTQDFPRTLAPQPYRIQIAGIDGRHAAVRYYSPAEDTLLPVSVVAATDRTVTLRIALTEVPALIEIDEGPSSAGEI